MSEVLQFVMCALTCGHYCLEHTMHWLAKLVCTGANLSMVCVYPHRYDLSHVYFTQEKYIVEVSDRRECQ